MPKIFALRDRLQAVQDFLIDTEEELQIFPDKQNFSKGNNHLKCSLPLVETAPSCFSGENEIRIFGKELIVDEDPFSIDDHREEVKCCETKEDLSLRQNNVINDISNPLTESSLKISTDQYKIKSAIETSNYENNLPEKSQQTSPKFLNGKFHLRLSITHLSPSYKIVYNVGSMNVEWI